MSTNDCQNIGVIPVSEVAIALPLTADVTGTWAFMTTFNGAYQYVQFTAEAGHHIVVPALLNEDWMYNFKLFKPDTSLFNDTSYCMTTIPLVTGIVYNAGNDTPQIAVGKLQYVATANQSSIAEDIFVDARQVAVFVEGIIMQEGNQPDGYLLNTATGAITFNSPLIEGQKIIVLYIK
ncbi:MAG: hypothetical protein JST82_01620 [Bacteroidetes bacterium]|nr:hypothetical protein [Bacteroidota bacterium]